MPISRYVPTSALSRAGVCTSTTRPASPYEGMVIYESDTDRTLVWNASAWVSPNSTTANPPGLELVATGTLSSTATNFVGCFTSAYDNYRIIIDQVSFSSAADVYWRMLSGTTEQTGANYSWMLRGINTAGTSQDSFATAQTLGYTGCTGSGVNNLRIGMVTMDITAPAVAQRTLVSSTATSYNAAWISRTGMSVHDVTTAYDGIRFVTNAAPTFAGNVSIYGYRK